MGEILSKIWIVYLIPKVLRPLIQSFQRPKMTENDPQGDMEYVFARLDRL